MITKSKFVSRYHGKLQGALNSADLYDLLKYSYYFRKRIVVGLGISCVADDYLVGFVSAMHGDGSFELTTDSLGAVDVGVIDVVSVTHQIYA